MITFAIFYAVCAFISYGYAFGYFQRRYPRSAKTEYWKDVRYAMIVALFGPVSIVMIVAFANTKYGFKLI